MMFGNVERLEIVVRRLDFGPFHHAEAEREENALDFLECLANQVARADGRARLREAKDRLSRAAAACLGGRFDFAAALLRVVLRRALSAY